MANVLDENVVILKFDNSDFQKNTQDSMSALDKLTNKLRGSNSEKGLEGLGKAAKSFNLDNMSNAVDKVNKRFSLFGIAGMSVVNRLTNSAITSAAKLATSLPNTILKGGWQRALNIEQAQFLIEGLGFTWKNTAEQAAKGMKDVFTVVDAAVTDTRYALDEAAGVASQLLSSGVTDLDKLETSLKAISGVGSITNKEYSDIGRIFAQVAGQGRMMGDDLLQLQQRNLDASSAIAKYLNKNKDVKQQALDNAIAMGRQTKEMKAIKEQSEVSAADIRKMVSAGAIDIDILSNSLVGFFEKAKEANTTYAGSYANLQAALKRVGETFETYKLKNFTKLFNALIPIIKKVKTVTDPLAHVIGYISNQAMDVLIKKVLEPLGKKIPDGSKITDLFKKFGIGVEDAGKASEKTSKTTKDLGNKLRVTTKEWKAALDIWNKGTYGNDQKRADAIRKLGMSYENVQGIINKFYETGFDWKKTKSFYDVTDDVAEGNEEIGETAEKAAPKLSKLGMVVKGILNIITTFKNVLIAFKNVMSAAWQIAKRLFSGAATGILGGFYKLSEYLVKATSSLANFTKKLKENPFEKLIKKFPNLLRGIQLVERAFKSIGNLFGSLFSNIKQFFTLFTQSEGFIKLKDVFKELLDALSDKIWFDVYPKISGIFGEITKFGSSGNAVEKLANLFSKLAGGLADFISKVRAGQNPFKLLGNAIRGLKDNLSFQGVPGINGKGGVFAKISDVLNFESIGKIGEKIQDLNIGEKLKGMFTGLVDLVKNADILEKLKSLDFGGFFKALGEKLGEVDWDRIIELATKIGGLVAAFVALRDMRKVTDAAVGTMGSVSSFFTSLGGVSDAIKKRIKMDSFKAMAIAIAILVGCIIALTLIPTKKLIPAMAGVLGILGAMTGIIAFMNSDKFDADKLKSVGVAFAGMGASILLLGVGMALIAKLKVGDIIKAGIAIAAFVGMLVLASKLSGDIKGAGGAFIGLATAVNLLLVAMLAFAALAIGTILKGGLVILGLVTSLALAARIANGSKTGGFVSMANAVNLLIPAILTFALMPMEKILKGGLTVVGLVTALGLAARIAGNGSLKGLTGVSVAVAVMTGSLVILSMIDTEKLIASGSALVALMISLSIAAKLAQNSIGGMIAMALILAMMSAALIGLASLDIHAPLEICASLSMLALSLAGALALFALITPAGAALGVAGLAIAIAGIGLILAGIGALDKALEKYNIEDFIRRGIPILVAIADGMGQAIGAFASGLLAQLATGGLTTVGKNLSKFMESINPFFDSLKDRESMSAAVGAIKEMASAFSELGKANLFNAVSTFLGGDNINMEEFGDQLKDFAKAFKKFAKEAGKISEEDLQAAYVVAKITKIFGDVQAGFESTGGFKGLIFGNKEDIATFGEQIGAVVDSVRLVIKKLKGQEISDKDVELIKPVLKVINAFNSLDLQKSGGVAQGLSGNTTIAEFGVFLSSFIDSFSTFLPKLRELDFGDDVLGEDGKLAKVCKVISTMVEVGNTIPPSEGLAQLGTGNTTINEFAYQLAGFVPPFNEFLSAVSGVENFEEGINKIGPVANAVSAMAGAAQTIPPNSGAEQIVFGGKNLGVFAQQLGIFAIYIGPFISNVASMNIPNDIGSQIGKLASVVKAMAKVADAIPPENILSKLADLVRVKIDKSTIESIATTAETISNNAEKIKTNNIAKFQQTIKIVTDAVSYYKSVGNVPPSGSIVSLGTNVSKFVNKVAKLKVGDIVGKAKKIKDGIKALGDAANKDIKFDTGKAKKAGESLAENFAKGMSSKKKSATDAAKKIASDSASSAKGKRDAFYKAGAACGQGLANGLKSKKSEVQKQATALASAAASATRAAAQINSPSKVFMRIGSGLVEGFVLGIEKTKSDVYDSSYGMALESLYGANAALSAIDDLSNPVITPVVDLTNVNENAKKIDTLLSTSKAMDVNANVNAARQAEVQKSQSMDKMIDMMTSSKDKLGVNATNTFNISVDGSANPEEFASRLVRQLKVEMRM